MKRLMMAGFVAATVVALASPGQALDKCKAKIVGKDGTIRVNANGVVGTLLWGVEAGKETQAFANPGTCIDLVKGKARKCELGAVGTPERITPPELCTLFLTDGTGTCTAYIRKCTPGVRGGCPGDMVRAGSICIDKYEASVWSTATGGTEYGAGVDNYPCNDNGQDCTGGSAIYARSVAGVTPSVYITWFQAQQACANAGKRLPTNGEWQMAVAGTPDTGGADNWTTTCNTDNLVPGLASTGSRAGCVSSWGAYDMVGNVWEWVADWVPLSTGCPGWSTFSDDWMCLSGASTTGASPGALIRGGSFGDWSHAGPFAVYGSNKPSDSFSFFGFRCAR